MRLALFEPDIPQNTGSMLRTAACFGVPIDLIEPCGFVVDDRRLRRAGMDYIERVHVLRHASWDAYLTSRRTSSHARLILLSARAEQPYTEFAFDADDTLLVGRETAGAPAHVHAAADARLRIPMTAGTRSLNVAVAAAMVLGEALRQTGGFPETP